MADVRALVKLACASVQAGPTTSQPPAHTWYISWAMRPVRFGEPQGLFPKAPVFRKIGPLPVLNGDVHAQGGEGSGVHVIAGGVVHSLA